jgi:RNA-directed DNA polymerase
MEVRYMKGIAIHHDPESCGGTREDAVEALTWETAGQPLSCEIIYSGVPTLSCEAEGNTTDSATCELYEDSTQSQTLSMRGNSLHGNREISPESNLSTRLDMTGKAHGLKPVITAGEKSDVGVVPMNDPNKDIGSKPMFAEDLEGRPTAKGNVEQPSAPRTQSRTSASSGLNGVRQAALAS